MYTILGIKQNDMCNIVNDITTTMNKYVKNTKKSMINSE